MTNGNDDRQHSQHGHCSLNHTFCIRERCELWQVLPMMKSGPLVGTGTPATIAGCTFNIQTMLLSQLVSLLARLTIDTGGKR